MENSRWVKVRAMDRIRMSCCVSVWVFVGVCRMRKCMPQVRVRVRIRDRVRIGISCCFNHNRNPNTHPNTHSAQTFERQVIEDALGRGCR